MSTGHLDLDALADVLAGTGDPDHLAGCMQCRAALDELRTASSRSAAQLAELPALSMPDEVVARLQTALRAAKPADPSLTTLRLPTRSAVRRRLPAAAAVVLLLAGAGYGISRLGGHDGSQSTAGSAGTTAAASPTLDLVRNSSGNDYTGRATLAAAVPELLAGTATASRRAVAAAPAASGDSADTLAGTGSAAQGTRDPLARLRDTTGLADCLLAVLPPDDPSMRPLALDYAWYNGKPAMVIVLPSSLPTKLDVFVVGPGCSRANDSTLFYASVDKP